MKSMLYEVVVEDGCSTRTHVTHRKNGTVAFVLFLSNCVSDYSLVTHATDIVALLLVSKTVSKTQS